MTDLIKATRKSIRFYGMGGTGINIVRKYDTIKDTVPETLRAMERQSYFDTSIANMNGLSTSVAYLCEDESGNMTDGGGSDRRVNAELIMKNLDTFLMSHPPADLNVVVFGASGATGSTAGPLLIEKLTGMGASVVSIVTVSVDSPTSCSNGYKTIAGLEHIVSQHNRPVVFTYSATDTRNVTEQGDSYQLKCMSALSVLASGCNRRIDGADVRNTFDFNKITAAPASLALLEIYHTESEHKELESSSYVSSVSVLRNEQDRHPNTVSSVSKIGYLNETQLPYDTGYFFGVSTESINKKVLPNLETLMKEAEQLRAVLQKPKSLFKGDVDSKPSVGTLVF